MVYWNTVSNLRSSHFLLYIKMLKNSADPDQTEAFWIP